MIPLDGCRTTPLASYMKGMGVFRLTAEQWDGDVRAFWYRDRFKLETGRDRNNLADFFLDEYAPSPVIGPWSLTKYRAGVEAIRPVLELPRMAKYAEAVESTEHILRSFCKSEGLDGEATKDDIFGEAKDRFIRLCRNAWPDGAVEWLDSAIVLWANTRSHNPLFGEGGNDGNFDVSENFAKRLNMVFADRDRSQELLGAALFGEDVELEKLTTFGHDPSGSGRPNSGAGSDGSSLANPWDHILMVEGMLMFAGGISRRAGQRTGRAVFPFVVESARAGYATVANEKDRGEVWLPLWGKPASYGEMRQALREGRAHYGGRAARTGLDFALAVSSMGVERGIDGFRRFGVLGRKGGKPDRPYHVSVDMDVVRVGNAPGAELVKDILRWYDDTSRFAQDRAPRSLKSAVRDMGEDIFALGRNPGPTAVQSLLMSFGRLERTVSGRTWPDKKQAKPFPGTLSPGWITAADDGSAEFRLAAAAASVRGADGKGCIRENLEAVEWDKDSWVAKPKSASCVWRTGSTLADNLGRVCIRRAVEEWAMPDVPPHHRRRLATLGDVEAFLAGMLNEQKIADLLLPLSMVRPDGPKCVEGENHIPVPAAYALAKVTYGTPGISAGIRPLRLLEIGRTAEALELIHRRARVAGMLERAGMAAGVPPDIFSKRLLGSLMFPVGAEARKRLLDMAAMREPPDMQTISQKMS